MINTTLSNMKLDGRKSIVLTDQEGKSIRIRASKAKEMMPDIPVVKVILEDDFEVNVIFDPGIFNGSNHIVIS